jgi:hypothetical protein
MVFPSCAFAECFLLAAVATILDKLTAVAGLVNALEKSVEFGGLTRTVDLGHHQAAENDLVEGCVGSAYCSQHTQPAQIRAKYLRARNLYRRTNNLT